MDEDVYKLVQFSEICSNLVDVRNTGEPEAKEVYKKSIAILSSMLDSYSNSLPKGIDISKDE